MTPIFFSSQSEFRTWLEENNQKEKEILVGFYKVSSGKNTMTWSQSVDQALCFGWIDGIRKSVDDDSYCIRFTPRKPGSNWSKINIRKVEELTRQGLMKPEGIKAFGHRKEERSGIYSFEQSVRELPEACIRKFKTHKKAWDFFSSQPPSYRKLAAYWINSAKQETTRLSRLEKTIAESGEQKRLFDNYKKKK